MREIHIETAGGITLSGHSGLRVHNGKGELVVQVKLTPGALRGLARDALIAAEELEGGIWP